MTPESVYLSKNGSRVRRHVSEGGIGLQSPGCDLDGKGNNAWENVTRYDRVGLSLADLQLALHSRAGSNVLQI